MKINLMKVLPLLALFFFTLSSCSIIESIFKAGVWVGILFVVGIIALIIFIISRIGGGGK